MNSDIRAKKWDSSTFGAMRRLSRKPRRHAAINPGRQSANATLLNALCQELKSINEGIVRVNIALFELVEEMKSLRVSSPGVQED